jgi:large repetitive protein
VNNTAKTWSYTPTLPATAGTTYRITARVADAAGNLGTASTARSFVLDTVAPATTAAITDVTDNVGLIKGSVAAGRRTDDRTPTIRGTIDAALASGETLRIFNGSTLLGSASVNNTAKTWSYTPTLPATAGTTYRITARVADAAGNLGTASTARSFVLDTVAPATTAAITDVTDNVGLIKGSVAAGRRTDDRTPTIRGTIDAALASGETLRIFNGSTLLGSASVNNTAKTWSYTPTLPATAGTTYRITARVADAAGNLGTASTARSFVLDTVAPATTAAITDVTDNVGLIKGSVAAGRRTDDRTPTIRGTIDAALASGETLRIFNGSTLLGSASVNNTAKTWSYTPTLPATAGTTYRITARVADAAGNLGTASTARSFVLDTVAPSVASFSPLDGASGVDPAANIILNFSEAIQRGTGTIDLRIGTATGAISESFNAATSSRLSISGGRLTINPTSNLATNTRYFLTFPAGSLTDRAGNPYAGTTTYDFRTVNAVTGTAANDILSFTSTVDRLTGLAGADTFRLTSLSHSLLPTAASTPIDRITDLVTGLDNIDAPVVRNLAQAVNPVVLGSVSELTASGIAALLTTSRFPALTSTSSGGAATFTFADSIAGTRTFLAINDGVAGFSPHPMPS